MKYNADEVLEIAERIEADGASFYRKAAKLHSDENAAFLLKLADMEVEHMKTFAEMRKSIPASSGFDTEQDYMEATLYLKSIADTHGGEGAPAVADELTGKETMQDILKTAIQLEEKSIVFYIGIRDMVPDDLGKNSIDDIIAEEKSHIVTLAAEMRRVTQQ